MSILDIAQQMVISPGINPIIAAADREAGWALIASLLLSMPQQVSSRAMVRGRVRHGYEGG